MTQKMVEVEPGYWLDVSRIVGVDMYEDGDGGHHTLAISLVGKDGETEYSYTSKRKAKAALQKILAAIRSKP